MYEEILDKIRFSFSRLSQFEECPYSFYLTKILDEEGVTNGYAEFGSLAHLVFADYLSGNLDIDSAIAKFQTEYELLGIDDVSESTMDKKYEQIMNYMTSFDESTLDKYEILGVEKEVNFKIDKYNFIGYIDLLLRDKASGKIIIVDHKSAGHFLKKDGGVLKNQEHNFIKYSRQMYLYSKFVFEEYGEYPSKIVWNHFLDNQLTVIDFEEKNYLEAIAWAAKTILAIYKEEMYEAKKSYLGCKLCDHRYKCEYLNEEEE